MRILKVLCVGSVLCLTVFTVIDDYETDSEDVIAPKTRVSEVVRSSEYRSSGKSVLNISEETRRKREIRVNGDGTKGREGKRKNRRERKRNTERYGDRKKSRKREPLTRHARRPQRTRTRKPHKGAGANRTRSRHRSHERRNLEKEYLVRNRTLELLEKKKTGGADNRSSLVRPVNNLRDVVFERRITPEKIGEILGEGRRAQDLTIADLLIPKTFFEAESKKNEIKINARIKLTRESETDRNNTLNRSAEVNGTPPLFLGKLKSFAMNVSRMNKVVENFKTNDSGIEKSAGRENYEDIGYRSDYENVFEDPSVSPWVNPPISKEAEDPEYFSDRALLSSVYMPIDDQITLQQGLVALLARLFQTLRNSTDDENQELLQDLDFDNSVQGDLCQKWLDCKDKLEEAFLGPLVLPACPCHYPSSIFYDDKIWDEGQQRHIRWRDVSGEAERLDVYKPGATYCIRSLLAQGGGSAAAQHCCYDGRRRLLTRGSGAGTPNFVSPEVSAILHERIDILPWRLCKGDFSRFNKVRPPNNDNHCKGNPDEDEYQRQIDTTKHYR